jgi:predicted PurR-regulated permease PerM
VQWNGDHVKAWTGGWQHQIGRGGDASHASAVGVLGTPAAVAKWMPTPGGRGGARERLIDTGLYAWALLGVVGVLYLAFEVLTYLSVVVVPVVLAFFVAGALEPLAHVLRKLRLPRALAALLALLIAVAVVGGVIALIVPAFRAQIPALIDSLQQAINQLQNLLPSNIDLQSASSQLMSTFFGGGGDGSTIAGALGTTVTILTGLVLAVVVAFFYLTEGDWLVSGLIGWLPRERQPGVREVANRLWATTGQYIRGILLVAFLDAAGIGLGLYLLGVPLALPLSVIVYLGAFIPVVGAFVSGLLAVLVAFAAGGLWLALGALLVVLAVQQLEGNVLQPLIMGRVIRLPAFVILVAVAIGFAWLGIIGGFLAVPVAASVARIIEYLTDERLETKPSDP